MSSLCLWNPEQGQQISIPGHHSYFCPLATSLFPPPQAPIPRGSHTYQNTRLPDPHDKYGTAHSRGRHLCVSFSFANPSQWHGWPGCASSGQCNSLGWTQLFPQWHWNFPYLCDFFMHTALIFLMTNHESSISVSSLFSLTQDPTDYLLKVNKYIYVTLKRWIKFGQSQGVCTRKWFIQKMWHIKQIAKIAKCF